MVQMLSCVANLLYQVGLYAEITVHAVHTVILILVRGMSQKKAIQNVMEKPK